MSSSFHLEISSDSTRIDFRQVHGWLSASYWAEGRPFETVLKAAQNSMNFGAFIDGRLVGYARVVTDRATFAWLCDVVVEESERGNGVGRALVSAVTEHPDLDGIKRIILVTRDAHGLYKQFGFESLPNPERWMVKHNYAQR